MRIVTSESHGVLAVPFVFGVTGNGSSVIGAIDIERGTGADGGFGTIEIDGTPVEAAVYERTAFADYPYTLYQALAVEAETVHVVWFYCEKGSLSYIYYESTDGPTVTYEPATGTCIEDSGVMSEHVAFPAVDMAIPPLLTGYTIDGPQVSLPSGQPGTLTLGIETLTVLPYASVDCTKGCGTPGWREVHALLWDPKGGRVCFAIFYLFEPGKPVLVQYALSIPDLRDPVGMTSLPATFTTP